jgi:hypothetical protein
LTNYIDALKRSHIRFTNIEDELVWKKNSTGLYTPKVGYIALNLPLHQLPKWWWKSLWKQKCPQKAKIFMWAALNNQIPTWENLNKHKIKGPGRCTLCKIANETTPHLLLTRPFTVKVWAETSKILKHNFSWAGDSMESTWKT